MTKELFQQFLLTYLHRPYIWGGDDPIRGLDCSGFAQEILAAIGLDPAGDQTAQALYNHFDNLREIGAIPTAGSLSFYGRDYNSIIHIAVHISNGIVIEAGGGGSRTLTLQDSIAQNAFIRLRPVKYRKDYLTTITPKGLNW